MLFGAGILVSSPSSGSATTTEVPAFSAMIVSSFSDEMSGSGGATGGLYTQFLVNCVNSAARHGRMTMERPMITSWCRMGA